MKKKIIAVIMIIVLMAIFVINTFAMSITDGDVANHTVKSTSPYNSLGFYTGTTNNNIVTFSYPTYVVSDGDLNELFSYTEEKKGNIITTSSEEKRKMGNIYNDDVGLQNFNDWFDVSAMSNEIDMNFTLLVSSDENTIIQGNGTPIECIVWTLDYTAISIDFTYANGTESFPYVYDNIYEGSSISPIINNATYYQYWNCFYNGEHISPYEYIQLCLDRDMISHDEFDALWLLLELSNPISYEVGDPDIALEWDITREEENNEALFRDYRLTIDRDTLSYNANDFYIILFGENQIRSLADMSNRGQFSFSTADGERVIAKVRYVGKFDIISNAINENGQYSLSLETIDFDISETYNNTSMPTMPNLSNYYNQYFNTTNNYINIREIYTYITIEDISADNLYMDLSLIYDKTPAMSENWVISQLGGKTLTFNTTHVSLDDVSFVEWLGETVSGFFGVEMFGGVTIGDILWFIIGLSCLFASLKYFAGG